MAFLRVCYLRGLNKEFCCEEHRIAHNRMISRDAQSTLRESHRQVTKAHHEATFLLHPMIMAESTEELDEGFERACALLTARLEKLKAEKKQELLTRNYHRAARNHDDAIMDTMQAIMAIEYQGVQV